MFYGDNSAALGAFIAGVSDAEGMTFEVLSHFSGMTIPAGTGDAEQDPTGTLGEVGALRRSLASELQAK